MRISLKISNSRVHGGETFLVRIQPTVLFRMIFRNLSRLAVDGLCQNITPEVPGKKLPRRTGKNEEEEGSESPWKGMTTTSWRKDEISVREQRVEERKNNVLALV